MDHEARIQSWADKAISTYELASALVGRDEETVKAFECYAGTYARYQLERLHMMLWRDGQFSAARACRAQIDALIDYEVNRVAEKG